MTKVVVDGAKMVKIDADDTDSRDDAYALTLFFLSPHVQIIESGLRAFHKKAPAGKAGEFICGYLFSYVPKFCLTLRMLSFPLYDLEVFLPRRLGRSTQSFAHTFMPSKAAMRSGIGGCVLNNFWNHCPAACAPKGLAMKRCAVVGEARRIGAL